MHYRVVASMLVELLVHGMVKMIDNVANCRRCLISISFHFTGIEGAPTLPRTHSSRGADRARLLDSSSARGGLTDDLEPMFCSLSEAWSPHSPNSNRTSRNSARKPVQLSAVNGVMSPSQAQYMCLASLASELLASRKSSCAAVLLEETQWSVQRHKERSAAVAALCARWWAIISCELRHRDNGHKALCPLSR